MPSSSHSSITDIRVMPSSAPRSGVDDRAVGDGEDVEARPLGDEAVLRRAARRCRRPRPCASNRPRVRSPQWKFLTVGSTELAGMRGVFGDDQMRAARLQSSGETTQTQGMAKATM